MLRQLFLVLTLCVSSMPLLFGADTGNIKTFTPRAESATAMRGCGVELEKLQEQKGYTRPYIFTGEEVLKNMRFCKDGKMHIDTRNRYRVTAGTIGWINEEGTAGVIELCINEFEFETPVGKEPEPEPQQPQPELPALVMRTPPNFRLPPWAPVQPQVPVIQQPPVQSKHDCPKCVAIRSSFPLAELKPSSGVVHVWAEIESGTLTDGVWTLTGKGKSWELGRGLRIQVDANKLYKLVGGKKGEYFLQFVGRDADGHTVACGTKGTPLTLVRKGRHWFWKLPVIHCAYTFTHDIKKWKGWPLVEKGVCLAEAAAAWYFWPVADAAKLHYIVTSPKSPL